MRCSSHCREIPGALNRIFAQTSMPPLLTLDTHTTMLAALRAGKSSVSCSLDLGRSTQSVVLDEFGWTSASWHYPWMESCKPRTIYHWTGAAFEPVARFGAALIKLVPTQWGPPTFEIDGIKMLPSAHLSPFQDAQRKVDLIQPRGKVILDTCGGLGYFASWCVQGKAAQVRSYEKNEDVLWLRSINPWSPETGDGLSLTHGDITREIELIATESIDAALHDPPRFGIAGELYSQIFYDQLARVLRRKGRLFHYTGSPNRLTSGRDVPNEVARRLQRSGFTTKLEGDGVLAIKK